MKINEEAAKLPHRIRWLQLLRYLSLTLLHEWRHCTLCFWFPTSSVETSFIHFPHSFQTNPAYPLLNVYQLWSRTQLATLATVNWIDRSCRMACLNDFFSQSLKFVPLVNGLPESSSLAGLESVNIKAFLNRSVELLNEWRSITSSMSFTRYLFVFKKLSCTKNNVFDTAWSGRRR